MGALRELPSRPPSLPRPPRGPRAPSFDFQVLLSAGGRERPGGRLPGRRRRRRRAFRAYHEWVIQTHDPDSSREIRGVASSPATLRAHRRTRNRTLRKHEQRFPGRVAGPLACFGVPSTTRIRHGVEQRNRLHARGESAAIRRARDERRPDVFVHSKPRGLVTREPRRRAGGFARLRCFVPRFRRRRARAVARNRGSPPVRAGHETSAADARRGAHRDARGDGRERVERLRGETLETARNVRTRHQTTRGRYHGCATRSGC